MNSDRFVYVKVNRKVAEFIGQTKWHPQMPDGNYLIFISELKRIDRDVLAHREETAAAIGAVLLTDPQASQEQRGLVCTPLPEATDPRFIIDPAEETQNPEDETQVPEKETTDPSEESPTQPEEQQAEQSEKQSEFSENSESSENSDTTNEEGGDS